jgi:P27 family predicted phage terminase small subunit
MKGQKPKPIQTRIAEGDKRGRGVHVLDDLLARQPKATHGLPPAPRYMTETQAHVYERFKRELESMELDYSADSHIVEGLAIWYVRALEADLQLERDGPEVQEPLVDKLTGQVRAYRTRNSPAIARSNQAWKQVVALSSEMGLSLVARQRVSRDSADHGVTDLLALLSGPYEKKNPMAQ